MRLVESYDLLAECEFPVARERLIEVVGDRQLEAPTGETESIGDVLARGDVATVGSHDEAYAHLVGNVSEAHVGRKYYDDRSVNVHRFDAVSF